MRNSLALGVEQCIAAVEQLKKPEMMHFMEQTATLLAECFRNGQKVLIAGNGGSLCDAMHFAEELTGQFRHYRTALPAIALADPSHMSCVANDMGFQFVFSRAIEAYGKPGDIFVGLTTSGNSPNMLEAFAAAQRLELQTIAFLGKNGGKLKGVADLECIVEGFSTSDRIQEAHMAMIHLIIEYVEELLFAPAVTHQAQMAATGLN